jgi:hypothetical protein
MLSATAYTLRQKARLAVSLATVGGFVDAVGFITLAGIFTSNMTGNTAALAARCRTQLERGLSLSVRDRRIFRRDRHQQHDCRRRAALRY